MEKQLHSLGLHENEIKIYLTLLPLGTAPASTLGLKTGIPRSTAKYACEQLTEKGLFTKTTDQYTVLYSVLPPEALRHTLERQEYRITQQKELVEKLIPQLKELFNIGIDIPSVRYFKGSEGLNAMLEDVLKTKKPLFGGIRIGEDMDAVNRRFFETIYIPHRKKLKNLIPAWIIFNDNEETREYKKQDHAMNRISMIVPKEQFPFDVNFHLYGNKVGFYSYHNTDVTGVLIENNLIRNTQYSFFKMAWNFARLLEVNQLYRKVELPEKPDSIP